MPPCRPMAEAAWCAQVSSSAAEIRSGQYEKVVLARYEAVHGIHRPLADVLAELEGKYPDSQVFAVWHSGQCFLGASPERLVSVSGETVDVDCLAGTEARGRTADEDEHLAAQLLESAKNRLEHEVVRAWIVEQLQTADVLDLTWPPTPQVKRLANVQHLHTPIRGRRREQQSVLDLVDELHPTPAVAGRPREKALAVIAERESLERGWYAGPVGWMNGRGEGQFAVALRSALVRGDTAYVFAGAGIMGDSNPALEWEETWMKMRAVRTALLPLEGRYSP
ncbi:hypothetical protein GCM10025857_36260 [Alicyclobacillus contaminans]|nr:hypothetical protein GCM10025857_36260 [Alicyclobacillus contaminans]